jgi:hypothetical protein
MAEEITDANDCIVKIGSATAGGASGALIIDSFEIEINKSLERQYGVGNRDAVGRTEGNREINLSFTHIGEENTLADDVNEGNFDIVLKALENKWEVDDVDGSFTITVEDDGTFELDFDGHGLSYQQLAA